MSRRVSRKMATQSNEFFHTQKLRVDAILANRADVRVAVVTRED